MFNYAPTCTPPLIPSDANVSTLRTNSYTSENLLLGNPTTWKQSVRATTTSSTELLGIQTVDGVLLEYGDRVLIKDNVGVENGIYVVGAVWIRAQDMEDYVNPIGAIVYTIEGLQNAGIFFVCNSGESFEPIRYINSMPINSIIYNYSLFTTDGLYGSEAFTWTNNNSTVTIGPYVNNIQNNHECIIQFRGSNTTGTTSTISTGASLDNSDSSLLINTGSHVNIKDKISTDGTLTITAFGETSGNINITTGTATNHGSLLFTPGYKQPPITTTPDHNPGNITFNSGYCNFTSFDTDNFKNINLIANTITVDVPNASDIVIQNGGMVFNKPTINVDFSTVTSTTINYKQALLVGSVSYVLAALTYKLFVINCNVLLADSLVLVNAVSFAGSAAPILYVINKNTTYFTVFMFNPSSTTGLNIGTSFSFCYVVI
jgi:hypothetical protein